MVRPLTGIRSGKGESGRQSDTASWQLKKLKQKKKYLFAGHRTVSYAPFRTSISRKIPCRALHFLTQCGVKRKTVRTKQRIYTVYIHLYSVFHEYIFRTTAANPTDELFRKDKRRRKCIKTTLLRPYSYLYAPKGCTFIPAP